MTILVLIIHSQWKIRLFPIWYESKTEYSRASLPLIHVFSLPNTQITNIFSFPITQFSLPHKNHASEFFKSRKFIFLSRILGQTFSSHTSTVKTSFDLHYILGHVSFVIISFLNKLGRLSVTSVLPKSDLCSLCQLSKAYICRLC